MAGFITIDRKLLDWEWHDDAGMGWLWITLLLMANYKNQKWHGTEVQRGQVVTSRAELMAKTGMTAQKIRTCLERLEHGGMIRRKSTNRNTLITICKYDEYQTIKEVEQPTSNQRATNEQPTNNQPISKQGNKGTKDKENSLKRVKESEKGETPMAAFVPPTLEEVRAYIAEKGYRVDADQWWNFYSSKGWMIGKNKMAKWKAAVATWNNRDRGDSTKTGIIHKNDKSYEPTGW